MRRLERLEIGGEHWVEAIQTYRQRFFSMIGCVHRIERHCARTDRDQAKGLAALRVFRNYAVSVLVLLVSRSCFFSP